MATWPNELATTHNTEMAFIKSIGDNLKFGHGLSKSGTIYLSIPKDPNHMIWPVIFCALLDPAKYIRNQIGVMGIQQEQEPISEPQVFQN